MFFYLNIFLVSIFSVFLSKAIKDKYLKLNFLLLGICVLALPLIFRTGIGTDYTSYKEIYNTLKHGGKGYVDIGWRLFNKGLIFLNLDYKWMFIISGLLTIMLVFNKTRDADYLYLLIIFILFLYIPSYNILRQVLSICFCLYALKVRTKNKQIILFIISVLLHISSIVIISIFLFSKKLNISKSVFIFIFLILFVLGYFVNLSGIIKKILGLFNTKYSYYLDFFNGAIESSGITLLLDELFFFFMVFFLDDEKTDRQNRSFIYLFTLGAVIFYSIARSFFIFSRFKYSFYLLPIYVLPYQKKGSLYKTILWCFFLVYFFLLMRGIGNGDHGVVPYQSFLL